MVENPTKFVMELKKTAASSGGDRYEAQVEGIERTVVIYWPQEISRPDGLPCPRIEVQAKAFF